MKRFLILCLAFSYSTFAQAELTHETVLPEEFTVYYHPEHGIATKPFKEGEAKKIPTHNDYKDRPGCYILCLSKNKEHSVYEIDLNTYLVGQIRVSGHYDGSLCFPKGYEEQCLAEVKVLTEKCETVFPQQCKKQSCWASPCSLGF